MLRHLRPELAAFALSALAIVGAVVCAVAHVPAPTWLEAVGLAGIAGGAGLAPSPTTAPRPPTPQELKQ